MIKRNIISIDEELCNGCGICVDACHEGALQMIDGKAKLVSESYCDGLGDCLPACPTGAITIETREAAPFDEAAVAKIMAEKKANTLSTPAPEPKPSLPCGCPGQMAKAINRTTPSNTDQPVVAVASTPSMAALQNWPVQIKLVPLQAPYLQGAALLIAADCTAFSTPEIHSRFMKGKVTLIGCPKLDEGDYSEKLTALLQANDIRSVTVLRMEVPCCAGIAKAVQQALINSGKMIPWRIITVTTDGRIIED